MGVRVTRETALMFGVVYLRYNIYTLVEFEFDPTKSAANKAKHGIDFVAAQALWEDPDYIERSARSATEPRIQVIGRIEQTTWSAFVTIRHEETIRIISVRRARPDEETLYRGA